MIDDDPTALAYAHPAPSFVGHCETVGKLSRRILNSITLANYQTRLL